MLPRILRSSLAWRRCLSDAASGRSKDPIYQTFLDKVREYRLKSPTGKPVDPTPEYEIELKEALDKLALQYGGGEGIDLLEFPKFKLPDVEMDPISILDSPEGDECGKKEGHTTKEAKDTKDTKKDGKEEKGEKAKKAKDNKDKKK